MVIDTFFFRTTAMVPHPHKVVVMLENSVLAVHPGKPQMDTISGIIDYTSIVAESTIAGGFPSFIPSALLNSMHRELCSHPLNIE